MAGNVRPSRPRCRETLLGALSQNAGGGVDRTAARAALDRLFQQLENPSAYDPRRFAPQLRRVADLLPRN